jgi:hypothetical protein
MIGSLLLCEFGKRSQGVAPHGIDVAAQISQAFGVQLKIVPRAAPLFVDKSRGL